MNLYELNKQVIAQFTPLTKEGLYLHEKHFNDMYQKTLGHYYMLLCNEYKYYTVFADSDLKVFNNFGKTICEVIDNIGEVYDIGNLKEGVIEIWIKPHNENEPFVFYLFEYDQGVVYFGK